MALCQNVYRRGAVYWYRRRFTVGRTGRSRAVAFSLGVREPRLARRIGAALNARAHEFCERMEAGMGTVEDAIGSVSVEPGGLRWHFTRKALDDLDRLEARTCPSPAMAAMTRETEAAILKALAREADAAFGQAAASACSRGAVDGEGRPVDARAAAMASEESLAAIHRAIAQGGRAARLSDAERQRLAARVAPDLVEFTEREIKRLAAEEALSGESWAFGPSRSFFEKKLLSHDVVPSIETIMGLRRSHLLICASLLEDHQRRHPTSPIATVLAALSDEEGVMASRAPVEAIQPAEVTPAIIQAATPPVAIGLTATTLTLQGAKPGSVAPVKRSWSTSRP